MSNIGTCKSGLPISPVTFCSKLIESVKMMASAVRLSYLEASQRTVRVTSSTSVGKLEVENVQALLFSWVVVSPCLTVKPHPDWSLVTDMRPCRLLLLLMFVCLFVCLFFF